jgi:hypothetical protein
LLEAQSISHTGSWKHDVSSGTATVSPEVFRIFGSNESGELVEFIGIVLDITEHKNAEGQLRRSEAYLAEAQRLSHTGTFAWSIPREEIFWSKETFQIFTLKDRC